MKVAEKIRVIDNTSTCKTWNPKSGLETKEFLARVFRNDNESKNKVENEALNILRNCGDPKLLNNNKTGIVIGYIQSGKTLSFTTLTTLARDNGYKLIIIMAGISNQLVNQSFSRLQKDLNIGNSFHRKWLLIKNPKFDSKDFFSIERELKNWKKPKIHSIENQAIVLVVMKNSNHLKNLSRVIKKIDMDRVPTLIIDDEVDQASLNTMARKNAREGEDFMSLSPLKMSTIYSRMRELKDLVPNHTFLQYTATPQAPLFIHLMDNLSPKFVQLLEPGKNYTGGIEFFKTFERELIRKIPYYEIPTEENVIDKIPNTLKKAMQIFFLGVASGLLIGDKLFNPKNRSMMVHPSRLTNYHKLFSNWIKTIKGHWERTIESEDYIDSKMELVNEFKESYDDLKKTAPEILPFNQLEKLIPRSITDTAIVEVNSIENNSIDWRSNYSFIIIGGQALDRGFTVEGLTVTYMPRNKGVGNADTIQQRARFYGYKKEYIGYCRVYLDIDGINSFTEYVEHEEDLRAKLKPYSINQTLDQFKRKVVLNELLNLTRNNVLANNLVRSGQKSRWYRTKAPHESSPYVRSNFNIYEKFKTKYCYKFNKDTGHDKRTNEQIHLVSKFEVEKVYHELVSDLIFTRSNDSIEFTKVKTILLANQNETCSIFIMSQGFARERSLNNRNELSNLFQGKNPKSGEIVYPGDMHIKEKNEISIQLHVLNIKNPEYPNDILGMAVWIPRGVVKQSTIELET